MQRVVLGFSAVQDSSFVTRLFFNSNDDSQLNVQLTFGQRRCEAPPPQLSVMQLKKDRCERTLSASAFASPALQV
jgi:hypothetical protein